MLLHLPVMFSQLRCTAVRMTGCGRSPLLIRGAFHFFRKDGRVRALRLRRRLDASLWNELRICCGLRPDQGDSPAKGSSYQ